MLECPICSDNFSSKDGIKIHCGIKHSNEENPFKIKKLCNNCGEKFYIVKSKDDRGKGKYCSMECRSDFGTIEKECKNCDKIFTIAKGSSTKGRGKYCSMECRSENKTEETVCKNCDKTFSVQKSSYKNGEGVYCSIECRSDFGTIEKECKNCDNKFSAYKSADNSGESKYCSVECYSINKRKLKFDLRGVREYREWKNCVLERDNYVCQDCGSNKNIQCHHIIPMYKNEGLATDIDNGIALCKYCHANRHESMDDSVSELIRNS